MIMYRIFTVAIQALTKLKLYKPEEHEKAAAKLEEEDEKYLQRRRRKLHKDPSFLYEERNAQQIYE